MLEARLINVPLSRISPIPHGVRKTNGISIEGLAASIKAEGLLQNLNVIPDPASPLAGAEEFQNYQVVAGNRRLRALRHLVDTKQLAEDYEVPCRVIQAAQALSSSLAENSIREPMHPGDEFVAFREMIDSGLSVEDIAARFGVTPLVVQRRLKLANVSPKLLDLFLEDKLNLDQMMALAISDDHKAQEKAYFKAEHDWQRAANELRATLTRKEISIKKDPIARFVGRNEYVAAGGVIHDDLFSNDGEGYITDVELLQRLAAKKLEAVAERVRAEAWSWVEVRTKLDYSEVHAFTKAEPSGMRKPDDAEKKLIKQLTAERVDNVKQVRKLEEAEEESDLDVDEECARLQDRNEAIDEQLEALVDARAKWDPKILAQAGAIVTIEADRVRIFRGLVKGKIKLPKDSKLKGNGKGSSGANADEPATLGHSAKLIEELTTATTFALSAELIANQGFALIALTHVLALRVFYEHPTHDDPVRIGVLQEFGSPQLQDLGKNVQGNADIVRILAERKTLGALLPAEAEDIFAWLTGEGNVHMVRLLAFCVAVSLNAKTSNEEYRRGAELAKSLGLDMSTRWSPKVENYLSRVSAPHIRAVMKEHGVHTDLIASTDKMKKAELADFAEQHLVTWVPPVMRF